VCFDRCRCGLISWFQGYQYTQTWSRRLRSHHIKPQRRFRLSQVDHQKDWRRSSLASGRSFLLFGDGGPAPRRILNESTKTKLGSKLIGKYDFSEPRPRWSKGDQETFRRGALVRAETPREKERKWKKWYSKSCYHEHPYWTDNLKYVC
jgi:hypothetical protein